MKRIVTTAVVLLVALTLSACGGGGGSDTGSVPVDTGAGLTVTPSAPDLAKQVNVGFGSAATKVAGLSGVALSSSRQTSTVSAAVLTASPNDLIMVRSGSVPLLLGFTFAGETGITVDYSSTAVALVLMQPSLLGATAGTQKSLVPIITADANFPALVNLITARVNNGVVDPLNTYVYPDIANYASLIAAGLPQQSPLAAKLFAKRLFALAANSGFTATLNASNPDVLTLSNPDSVYYDVTVNDRTKLLEAKDGVVNLNYSIFPPETSVVSDKTTSFSLVNDFLKPVAAQPYEIDMTCKFNLNPLVGSGGVATWRNIVKGLAIAYESLGISLDYTNSAKFENFVKRYEQAFGSVSTQFNLMKQNTDSTYYYARKIKALTHVMNIVIDNLPLPADGSFSSEDKSNIIKTMSAKRVDC